MTTTYHVSGQAIFDTLESIRLQGGHACDYRYLPGTAIAEIKAHFPNQPELKINETRLSTQPYSDSTAPL